MGIDIGGTLVKLAYVQNEALQFTVFEVKNVDDAIAFISDLASKIHGPSTPTKLFATGGGAIKYASSLQKIRNVEIENIDEMASLVRGLFYFTRIPKETFTFGAINLATFLGRNKDTLDSRSSTTPIFEDAIQEDSDLFPCLLVNIGSGVSVIKVDGYDKYERISGTALGGGTFSGLVRLLTGAKTFDEALELADLGDSSNVDLLVGDIYGKGYDKIGLNADMIASSFGKARRDPSEDCCLKPEALEPPSQQSSAAQDVAASALHMITVNIGQIAYLNAKFHNIKRIYFSGYFIRGHLSTMQKLTFAIHFWSKGSMKALFLRHEGYLGAMGSLISNEFK